MGYYAEYFSTILKSDFALAYKQRWDSRRVIRYSREADKIIYDEIINKVEVEHKVTYAIKRGKKATEDVEKALKYALQLAFNSSIQDGHVLKTAMHLMELVGKFNQSVQQLKSSSKTSYKDKVMYAEQDLEKLSRKFALNMAKQAQKAEAEEREEMKDLMNLIEQSHKQTKDTFISAVKQRFSSIKSQTILARYAFRFDIQHEKTFISRIKKLNKKLEKLSNKFEKILQKIDKRYKELPEIVAKFKDIVKESEKDIEEVFLSSYKIKKRDFSIMLAIIVNAEVLKNLEFKWIRMHYMPEMEADAVINNIDELQQKLGEKLHVSAQALRISVKATQDLKNKAMPLI